MEDRRLFDTLRISPSKADAASSSATHADPAILREVEAGLGWVAWYFYY
jgi:hypothetical protein